MQISYCDLCGAPLKEGTYWMLYISSPYNNSHNSCNDMEDYYRQLKDVQKDVKEICPNCKHVFDEMFRLRLAKLSELSDEINYLYNLTSKKNTKDKKNGKEKE